MAVSWAEQDVSISDRCLFFRSLKQFEAFASDPEGYLKECGALDGLPGFKGIKGGVEGIQEELAKLRAEHPTTDRLTRIPIYCHIYGPVRDFCYYGPCGSVNAS